MGCKHWTSAMQQHKHWTFTSVLSDWSGHCNYFPLLASLSEVHNQFLEGMASYFTQYKIYFIVNFRFCITNLSFPPGISLWWFFSLVTQCNAFACDIEWFHMRTISYDLSQVDFKPEATDLPSAILTFTLTVWTLFWGLQISSEGLAFNLSLCAMVALWTSLKFLILAVACMSGGWWRDWERKLFWFDPHPWYMCEEFSHIFSFWP